MAQQKNIKFGSITTVNPDNSLTVNSFNTVDNLDVYQTHITEIVTVENSVNTLEGFLLMAYENNLINASIDINGNLLILYENSENFSINENGELVYTFN
jgi:hypothetical protein